LSHPVGRVKGKTLIFNHLTNPRRPVIRNKREKPLPLFHIFPDHQMSRELRKISEILDENPKILDLLLHDLCDTRDPNQGAGGLSPELTLRAAIVKQMHGFSYEQLAFHLIDSSSFRAFVRLPLGWTPNRSTLQRNISRISPSTWQRINQVLVGWATQKKLEKGRKIRVDSTAVAADIHYPTDSELLYDCIRTITRLLKRLRKRHSARETENQAGVVFCDHTRRAKKRRHQITNRRGARREAAYRDLLKVAHRTFGYAAAALADKDRHRDPFGVALPAAVEHYLGLMGRVIDQTERRVLRGEQVPAREKVFSIFEEHTDIIQKGQREAVYGHKIFLSCAPTSLISNCFVVSGNPADSTQLERLLDEHHKLYGSYPRQMAADQGFYSGANLESAKGHGIQDVGFERKGSVKIEAMVRSSWIYKQLRRFRAGVEGCISWLKRIFGLRRCTWKGWEHFLQYVQASVVSYNLLVLARLLLR
jgi:transposase, IS5 family